MLLPMRKREEVEKMVDRLRKERKETPLYDIFGGSNAEARAELEDWSTDLSFYLLTGITPPLNSEARRWLMGESSILEDYEETEKSSE